jgi:hypothetical protein
MLMDNGVNAAEHGRAGDGASALRSATGYSPAPDACRYLWRFDRSICVKDIKDNDRRKSWVR